MDWDQRRPGLQIPRRRWCVERVLGRGISNCPSLCVLHRTEKRLVWSCWEIGSTVIRPATRRRRRDGGGKGGGSRGRSMRQSECFFTCTWCATLTTYLCYAFGTRGRPVELCQQALAHHLCPELHHPCLLPVTQEYGAARTPLALKRGIH